MTRNKKDKSIHILVTEKQKKFLREYAFKAKLSVGEIVRRLIVNIMEPQQAQGPRK